MTSRTGALFGTEEVHVDQAAARARAEAGLAAALARAADDGIIADLDAGAAGAALIAARALDRAERLPDKTAVYRSRRRSPRTRSGCTRCGCRRSAPGGCRCRRRPRWPPGVPDWLGDAFGTPRSGLVPARFAPARDHSRDHGAGGAHRDAQGCAALGRPADALAAVRRRRRRERWTTAAGLRPPPRHRHRAPAVGEDHADAGPGACSGPDGRPARRCGTPRRPGRPPATNGASSWTPGDLPAAASWSPDPPRKAAGSEALDVRQRVRRCARTPRPGTPCTARRATTTTSTRAGPSMRCTART